MAYQVTARKWRPMIFDDVIGQEHVTSTLRNALATHRVAHAYLFSGTRGCGKTTTARILARALNCTSPQNNNPDNTCEACISIIEGRSLDVIEIDGASNRGVDEIRNLRDSVRYMPTQGTHKIYIIDEVHMLTKEAFNALLKTLEEPPEHVVFVFATTEVQKVPMTILSRCQRFDFRRLSVKEITASLLVIAKAENVQIDDDALMIIAKRADGSMRDSQSIFDQVQSFCGKDIRAEELLKAFNVVDQELYFRFTDILKKHDARGTIEMVDEIMKSGYDLHEFVGGLTEHIRNMLIVRSTGSSALIDTTEHMRQQYRVESESFSERDLLRYLNQIHELVQSLRWSAQPRYRLEAALLQIVTMDHSIQISELLEQIEDLKKKIMRNETQAQQTIAGRQVSQTTPATELKLVGEAKAGYLTSKAALGYSSLIGTDLGMTVGVSQLIKQPVKNVFQTSTAPVLQSIAIEEVLQRWPDFVEGVAKSQIELGTFLQEVQILDLKNGLLKISCSDEYHYSSLKRNKEFLADILLRVIGKRITIEPVLRPLSQIKGDENNTRQLKSVTMNEIDGTKLEHPVLTLLIKELSAEHIE